MRASVSIPDELFRRADELARRLGKSRSEDRLEIRLLEVLSDVEHEMGEAAALEKDGVERDLQLLLADNPGAIEDGRDAIVGGSRVERGS